MAQFTYHRIPKATLVAVAKMLAGHKGFTVRRKGISVIIRDAAYQVAPLANGHRYNRPNSAERAIVYAAFDAAKGIAPATSEAPTPSPAKSGKGKAPHRVKGSPEAKAWGAAMAAKRAAKSGNSVPAPAKPVASGGLTAEEKTLLLSLMQKALAV